MATITKRRAASGEARYTAQIRIRRDGRTHTEARTFGTKGAAEAWAKRRETELEQPGAMEARSTQTVGELIDRYTREFESVSKWKRTKSADLKRLQAHGIAGKVAVRLTSSDLVQHVQERLAGGVSPATAGNDLAWLGSVLRAARSAWGLPVQPNLAEDARDACRRLRLVGKSKQRDRRPTVDELQRLLAHFRASRRLEMPMADIVEFAVASARRQEEICRLMWADLRESTSSIVVRDVKHPGGSVGNDVEAKLTAEAMAIIQRQPRTAPQIFPYNSKSVGSNFTRACQILGIDDLHFHDLRHEATSRLVEAGYSVPEVALFTLHRSWKDLQRYANLRPAAVVLR